MGNSYPRNRAGTHSIQCKTCEFCDSNFVVHWSDRDRRFCGRSCASKFWHASEKTPERIEQDRTRLSLVRQWNHKKLGQTPQQKKLADALGWPMEVIVPTGQRRDGIPSWYAIDVANEDLKIAIEVDGSIHWKTSVQEADQRKTKFLESLGWKVLRFWNGEVDRNLSGVLEVIHGGSQ